MYARCFTLRNVVQNLLTPNSYQRLIRFQLATATAKSPEQSIRETKFIGNRNEDIFLDLTMDYNRRRYVRSDLINNAIENISTTISERLSLLILTAAARCVHHVTPERRVELLEEVWKTLKEKNVRLTTRHYEIYLSGLNENGFIFDADFYLKLIDKEEIQATPRLYSLLLTQYCREGNTDRAQNFLKMLKERNVSIDEDIFAALVVCQLKLGNDKGANDIIQIMKERGLQPTISTYKEILTALISEHKIDQFEFYFGQIENQQRQKSNGLASNSTVYVDAPFVVILMGQCVSYKERPIFDLLLNKLKTLDYHRMPNNLFNLAVQCVSNSWHDCAVELLSLQTEGQETNNEISPYQGIYGRQWILFFKHLFENNESNLIEIYLEMLTQKNLIPLDAILRSFYNVTENDFRQALDYLERGQQIRHPMRTNYFYPLLLNAFAEETSSRWTDDDRLRLFRLLDRLAIPIESSTYSRLIQQSFHKFYQNDFQSLLKILNENQLQSILDRFCRLLLADIRRGVLPLNTAEQIAPYFRLNLSNRQEEFAKQLFSFMAGLSTENDQDENLPSKIVADLNAVFQLIDSIAEKLSTEIPLLKRELYVQLLRFSAQNRRNDLTKRLADRCIEEKFKLGGSMNEIDALTGYVLPRDVVEQLARYKPGEMSWNEKLASMDVQRTNRTKLEQIYQEAKQDGRYPFDVQRRLLDIYIQRRSISQGFSLLHEMISHGNSVEPSILHRLFDLVTLKLDETDHSSKAEFRNDLQFICDLYNKSFNLNKLPCELTFRLAHMHMLHGDQDDAIRLIVEKVNTNLNDEIFQHLMKFLQVDASLLTAEGLMNIGKAFFTFRTNESIRKFWNLFFDILLQKTSPQDVVQFYSDAMRENSNIPYAHLFELFIKSNELNRLQDVVDVATLQHGPNNVLHDLGFALIQAGNLKQAEKIFQTPWLKARNERINLHALLLADSNNIDALIDAIRLTRNLPNVDQKQLFAAAIRVAVRLDKSDMIDWLVTEVKQNNVQLDPRVKKYLDAHLLSKGLDPLKIETNENGKASSQGQDKITVHN